MSFYEPSMSNIILMNMRNSYCTNFGSFGIKHIYLTILEKKKKKKKMEIL